MKKRNFAFVLYPETIVSDWKDKIISLGAPCVCILHDRDLSENGELKKPHYHFLISFKNARSEEAIRKFVVTLGGNAYCEQVYSKKAYARYLLHLDNPEKVQYSEDEVVAFNGAVFSEFLFSESEIKDKGLFEIFHFCRSNKIFYFSDLVDYCVDVKPEWLSCLKGLNGQLVYNYIKSCDYRDKYEVRR